MAVCPGVARAGGPRVYVSLRVVIRPFPRSPGVPIVCRVRLAPVPFVSASARWFTCACSRFFGHRCVCLSWPNLSRGSCVRAASVSSGLRTATHLSRFSGLRARRACTRILLSLSLGGEGSRTPPPPPARACAKSLARESMPIVRAHCACHARSREAMARRAGLGAENLLSKLNMNILWFTWRYTLDSNRLLR